MLVAVAPLAYTCFGKLVFGALPGGVQGIGVKGWGWTFLLAATFTVCGALGQLTLQVLRVEDICLVAQIRQAAACVLGTILGVLGFFLAIYAFRSIVKTVRNQPASGALAAATVHETRWALI